MLAAAVVALSLVPTCTSKVITARIDTTLPRYSDIYLGAFTFDSKGGKIQVKTDTEVRGQRFLFFDSSAESWPSVLATYQSLTCLELRNVSLMVTQDQEEGSLSEGLAVPLGKYKADLELSHTPKPAQWFTILSNCDYGINLSFTITFLNPGGWWFQHFTVDEQGLLGMFLGWSLMYTVGGAMLAWAQWQLYRSQSLHPVCILLSWAVGLQYLSLLLQSMHGMQYATDGLGLVALQGLGEVADAGSNAIIMVLMLLLAKGWTTTSKGASETLQLPRYWVVSVGAFAMGFLSLFVIERVGRAMDQRYCYDSDLGVFGLVLRSSVYFYFVICISRSKADEELAHRRHFLGWFSLFGAFWFMSLPVTFFLAQFLEPWDQMKLVIGMGITTHTLALVGLGALTWPRVANEYVTITAQDMLSGTPYDEI